MSPKDSDYGGDDPQATGEGVCWPDSALEEFTQWSACGAQSASSDGKRRVRLIAAHLEACPDGVHREIRVASLAREALFLDCRDDISVDHERSGRIVVQGGDAENRSHGVLTPR